MNKGFSLVELIVVIAIMAILVGVAVPVYTSYITKAEQSTDIQAIDNLEHACKIVGAEYSIKISYSSTVTDGVTTVTATLDTTDADVDDAYTQLGKIIGDNATANDTAKSYTITLKTAIKGDVKLPYGINGGTPARPAAPNNQTQNPTQPTT